MNRYVLREGSRGGERILADAIEPDLLFERLDELMAERHPPERRLDVIDTDATDPPESGVMERCPGCGVPTLASRLQI
jgi:hypothetical protein